MSLSLVEKFTQAILPKSEWTHQTHLTVALQYLHTYEFDDAVCRLKSGIILLNHFHGIENTDRSGYHETLTIFWSKLISIYIDLNRSIQLEELINKFLTSSLASKELPFQFYSKREILTSPYRAVYHEPTLQKLDLQVIEAMLDLEC